VALIEDVSPTLSNTSFSDSFAFASGRMLSLAASEDGTVVFAGALASNVWLSEDRGKTWSQLVWPQPPAGQFGVPGAIGGSCIPDLAVAPDSARWFVDRDLRLVADITGDGFGDIVGFGDTGVWTALGKGDGTFFPPRVVLADFGADAGGWRVDEHPRVLADLTGNGRADIVGFGDSGIYVALADGDGTFGGTRFALEDFGPDAGGWHAGKHPRFVADLTGNGCADVVGFGDAGVYVALGNGDGTFQPTQFALADFGYDSDWRVDRHVRVLADVTGDGRLDIVGFGEAGVYVALGNGDGTFQPTQFAVADLGYDSGWRVDRHVRLAVDLTGEGRADLVGFGEAGVYVALGNGDGTFQPVAFALADLGFDSGWRVDRHPRFVADVTGEGRADLVGFGNAGVYVAYSNGDGTFTFSPQPVVADFGYEAGGWRVEKHPRVLADLTGNGRADIVGFGNAGVLVALANADGSFQLLGLVLSAFGVDITVLALVRNDRELEDAGLWRSSDRGANWTFVHSFPRDSGEAQLAAAGQIVWASGTANVVYAAGGSALAVSHDAGLTFTNLLPLFFSFQPITHIAVAPALPGALAPEVVYAISPPHMFVSFDGGATWVEDLTETPRIGGAVGLFNSQSARVMVVSPRSSLEIFATADSVTSVGQKPALVRGDFSQFADTHASQWHSLVLPDLGDQDSGNVFLDVTRPGNGLVLFYGPQRSAIYAGPPEPVSPFQWQQLGDGLHVDLHGLCLSADFAADFEFPGYTHLRGTIWATSDGGVHWSDDGGASFHRGENVNSLSCVNIAGVAVEGNGPVISMNTGDNDGFASSDGGRTWHRQQYGGGDNDCSFADPLRPDSMLIFTPRWDEQGNDVAASRGTTVSLYESSPGALPDIAVGSEMRHIVPGPPLRPKSTVWNAGSGFALRGYRPIVQNLPDDDPAQPGDYVFIRFFGNEDLNGAQLPNNLAILLRTRRLREIKKRTDWDTPGGWRVEKHPRVLADIAGSGQNSIVGFGDEGVWTAVSTSGGSFEAPQLVLRDFGYDAGGWRVEKHPRLLADITGDGRADVVGFADAGVYVSLSNGDGTFGDPQFVLPDFGAETGGWQVNVHPRLLADLRGNGRADIVGFADDGVHVALANGDGTFEPTQFVLPDFGAQAGGWEVDRHPRFLADVTGNGNADIVGFADDGVYVALGNGDGTFQQPQLAVANFGAGQQAGNWYVNRHPRFLADITGDGRADIVGFGDAGVYVALAAGGGAFGDAQFAIPYFGFASNPRWRLDRHPRLLADVDGDGRADIIGFGNIGVYVALSNGDGTFSFDPQPTIRDFGYHAGNWRVNLHPRFAADVSGDGRADIVGFGSAGVWAARSLGNGGFQQPSLFVIPNFGFGDSGPVELQGPFLPAADAGVVQAVGGHERTVFYVGGDSASQLWKWSQGMTSWERIVPGGIATESRRFFAHPYISHIVYVLDAQHVLRSDDGGATWQVDASLEEQLTCGSLIPIERNAGDDSLILTDMQFDPQDPGRRFAVGLAGAFMTRDGANWERLLDTGALRGRPANCYFDRVSNPDDPALYVSFAGRSIVKISAL
jgi:VCBS repeat protein